jgi:hypothetical protein
MTEFGLLGPAMASKIDRYRPIVTGHCRQLRLEVSKTRRGPMQEHDRVPLTVILVIEISPVALDNRHSSDTTLQWLIMPSRISRPADCTL